jgi:hypothetical protein
MSIIIMRNVSSLSGIRVIIACSPEVDIKELCDGLKEAPKDNWKTIEATDFIKNCIL